MRAAGREFQCSSASRKFLNLPLVSDTARRTQFQCSSASRKFLNYKCTLIRSLYDRFQCSSASRKFLNFTQNFSRSTRLTQVSVLFSEPKISQFLFDADEYIYAGAGFSALQRAENFSILHQRLQPILSPGFQCSSASRKFLNSIMTETPPATATVSVLFSEPKISQLHAGLRHSVDVPRVFQCSSASRKFLNPFAPAFAIAAAAVSVLFSEPKISQLDALRMPEAHAVSFSALQRAENFSIQ